MVVVPCGSPRTCRLARAALPCTRPDRPLADCRIAIVERSRAAGIRRPAIIAERGRQDARLAGAGIWRRGKRNRRNICLHRIDQHSARIRIVGFIIFRDHAIRIYRRDDSRHPIVKPHERLNRRFASDRQSAVHNHSAVGIANRQLNREGLSALPTLRTWTLTTSSVPSQGR